MSQIVCRKIQRRPNPSVEGLSSGSRKACWCSGDTTCYLQLCRPSPLKWCWATDWARGQRRWRGLRKCRKNQQQGPNNDGLHRIYQQRMGEEKNTSGSTYNVKTRPHRLFIKFVRTLRLWGRPTSTSLFFFPLNFMPCLGRQSLWEWGRKHMAAMCWSTTDCTAKGLYLRASKWSE